MRLKQTSALLLASAMLVGSVGMMNPTEVRAAGETNTFTLTVPADTNITKSGWNDIGSVEVSNVSIETGNKIEVTITNGATGRNLVNTTDSNKKVGYEIKKGNATTNEAFGDKLEFEGNGTQAIGADVADFSTAEVGTYEDTINFTAALASAAQVVTYERTGKEALSSANLGEPTSWTYNTTTYQVYNAFIPSSSDSSWNDAKGFVNALNDASYDGHTDWTLLSSEAMARAWYDQYKSSVTRGVVDNLWSSVENNANYAYVFDCDSDRWDPAYKASSAPVVGFVVLRGSSAAPVAEYTLTGERSKKNKLTSTDLLASANPTTFTFTDGKTYTAYNGYISETSGANWNDGVAFVEALNAKEIDGRTGGWTLLTSKEMAYAWWLTTDSAENKGARSFGDVNQVWTGGEDGDNGYCAYCDNAAYYADDGNDVEMQNNLWLPSGKTLSRAWYGFVVLRGSSSSSDS